MSPYSIIYWISGSYVILSAPPHLVFNDGIFCIPIIPSSESCIMEFRDVSLYRRYGARSGTGRFAAFLNFVLYSGAGACDYECFAPPAKMKMPEHRR